MNEPLTRQGSRLTPAWIVAAMVGVVVLLGITAYGDERREASRALADFGAGEVAIANAIAEAVRASWEARPSAATDVREVVKQRLRPLENPGEVEVLLRPSDKGGLETLDGRVLRSPPIEARFGGALGGPAWVRLTHEESAALGLPPRTAIAGLTTVDLEGRGRWGIAVVASAHRERDREERGLWRVFLGFLLASGVVVTFGTFALRKQRADLALEHRLAVAEAVQARDERLVRADKLATLGAMAMGIAHQVATPLSVITARAERLSPRVLDDERAKRAVAAISEQAQKINEIIRAFLQLARGGTPTLVHTRPADLIAAAVELAGHRFDKASVTLRVDVAVDLPPIACDARLFEQVLVNLVLNACDACSPGGTVTVSVRGGARDVTFTVDDDGVGIPKEVAERATEPFFSTKPQGEGAGLGLAIAKEIVGHHHGTLEIGPRPEGGTRARVVIPTPESSADA